MGNSHHSKGSGNWKQAAELPLSPETALWLQPVHREQLGQELSWNSNRSLPFLQELVCGHSWLVLLPIPHNSLRTDVSVCAQSCCPTGQLYLSIPTGLLPTADAESSRKVVSSPLQGQRGCGATLVPHFIMLFSFLLLSKCTTSVFCLRGSTS